MNANIFLIFLLLWTFNFYNNAKVPLQVRAKYTLDSFSNKIVIINSFDAMSVKARNNKRELLRELTDSLKDYLAKVIRKQTGGETILIPGILADADNQDSLVFSLIKQNNAGKAILILSNDVYFEETGVEETIEFDGKIKNIASYDLCASNKYTLYSKDKILQQSIVVDNCEFFTNRNAGRGHFTISIGPNVVAKKKHTFGILAKNAEKYVSQIAILLSSHN
jgi:hypothetical protein